MEISTALSLALVLCIALWVPFFIITSVGGRRADTPGSPGGSRGVTPTSARTLVEPDRLGRAQTMRGGLVTDWRGTAGIVGSAGCLAAGQECGLTHTRDTRSRRVLDARSWICPASPSR